MGSERDDRDVVRRRIVLQHLRRFPPVDDGNRDVHEDQIRLLSPGFTDALFAVERFRDGVAEVTEALNGEEGIAKARSEKPDLILMDISIPIIDGWEATQVLKHDPATKSIPIIALTAHALASDREKAMEVG